MDKYELRIILASSLVLAIFLVAVLKSVSLYAKDVPECIPFDEAFTNPGVTKIDDKVYQVFVSAQMWSFEPNEIYLPVGAHVDFYLSSADVVHGFHLADVGVNLMAVPGGITKTSVQFNKPGVYEIICHEYCGSGHQHMRGEVVVNYPVNTPVR